MTGSSQTPIRIGTRSSPLALAQTQQAIELLNGYYSSDQSIDVVKFVSTGDQIQDRPLADIGGKGLFSKELDKALLDNAIDAAVHSAKDLETEMPEGIVIGGVLPREDPADVLISAFASTISGLPEGAVFGTSSVRRAAQILRIRPDIVIKPIRGNVDTRVRKLRDGEAQATILAAAGLNRLNRKIDIAHPIPTDTFIPAAGQGIIAITCRANDENMLAALQAISDPGTLTVLFCERAVLAAVDGTCRTPLGAYARLSKGDQTVVLDALYARTDGSQVEILQTEGPAANATAMGLDAGNELKSRLEDNRPTEA